jgi:hypothetical protein
MSGKIDNATTVGQKRRSFRQANPAPRPIAAPTKAWVKRLATLLFLQKQALGAVRIAVDALGV